MLVCPYLHFDGTCAEAFRFYATVFGQPEPQLMPWTAEQGAPPEAAGRMMHAQLALAPGSVLMGTDFPQGDSALPQQSVSLNAMPAGLDEGRRLFAALAEGGTVISPLAATFFSPGFGVLRDRFGVTWMINVNPPPA